jgi:hypothetical protein
MLHWILEQFDVRGTVVIIRHPCAVISSMMRWADYWRKSEKQESRVDISIKKIPDRVYNQNKSIFSECDTQVKKLAIDWCLKYWYTLFEDAKRRIYPFVLTTYESLVTKGRSEFKRVCNALELDEEERQVRSLRKPSSTVSEDAKLSSPERQLSKWKQHLTNTQVDKILNITDAFDMGIYSKSIQPSYDKLWMT